MRLLLLILISLLSFNISCEKETQEGDIEVIINESKPLNPSFSLKFEEDLSITEEGWYPVDIAVDDEENIYVFGEKEMFIYKYDSQGNEIFKKVFPKGQGPGDFFFMDPFFSSDGKLYIFDKQLHRLTILNNNCEIQNTTKFEDSRYLLQLDSKGNMFFWVGKSSPDGHKHILSKFSPSGRLLDEIFEYVSPSPDINEEKMIFSWPLYYTAGIYKLDSSDNIYYAINDKYEINVISPEGKLVKKIIKLGQSREVTEKDTERVMPPVTETPPFKTEFIAPEHVPHIADFFILDNNYILVITHENDYDEKTLAGNLFDDNGIFQNRVDVPKYYLWNIDISTSIIKKNALYKKNHFYTIESDKNEENFYVKRYKVIWNDN